MSICDYCKKICKKTPFGSCVILTKSNITLCIECNSNRLKVEAIKNKQNILKFLVNRENGFKKYLLN